MAEGAVSRRQRHRAQVGGDLKIEVGKTDNTISIADLPPPSGVLGCGESIIANPFV